LGETVLPSPLDEVVIHAVVSDEKHITCGKRGKMVKKRMELKWSIFLRGTKSLSNLDGNVRGKHLVGLVASQFGWLFDGTETQGLTEVGIKRAVVLRGPIPVQNAHFILRQFVVEMVAEYHVVHNI